MATRILLRLGDSANRCFLTAVQSYKTQLQPQSSVKYVRQFRTFKNSAKDSTDVHIETGSVHVSKLLKPLVFTVVFSSASLVTAVIWQYENLKNNTYSLSRQFSLERIRRTGWRGDMERWWKSLSEGQKVFAPILFLNVIVFLAWQVPAFQATMRLYFTANPAASAVCWPMLFNTFSHASVLHLAVNMYVLHNFSTFAVSVLGKEQFVAFYLSSGLMASFASYAYKSAFSLAGASLGASGAIMGLIGFMCSEYPEINMAIIFFPSFKFTGEMALKGAMGVDLLGCIMRWRFLDHAAHLGGALWGIFWHYWGNTIWKERGIVLQHWIALRQRTKAP